jgi:type IV pilus assembly protein PilN
MIKINLLPKEARKRVGVWEQLVLMAAVVVLTVVAVGIGWGYLNSIIEQKKQQIEKTQQRLDELKKVIAEIDAFEKQRAALEQKLKVIAQLQKEQQLPVHLLDEIYLTLEDDLWLRSFQQSGDNLNFQGSALSNPVIANYQRKLEKSNYFDNVELVVSQRRVVGTQEVRDFQITTLLIDPEEKAKKQKPEEQQK